MFVRTTLKELEEKTERSVTAAYYQFFGIVDLARLATVLYETKEKAMHMHV
jgi:hypothetical protein